MKRVLPLLFWICLAASSPAQNWPSFRGPGASGVADEQKMPLRWNAENSSQVLWDISLKEGQESNESIAWSKKRGGVYIPTPLLYDDYLYMCANNGVLSCYNAKSGEKIYQERIADKGGAFTASPVAAAGRLYLTSEEGEIYVVKAGPKYELLATNPMNEVCMATPAISGGMIFIRTQHNISGIGEPFDSKAKLAK